MEFLWGGQDVGVGREMGGEGTGGSGYEGIIRRVLQLFRLLRWRGGRSLGGRLESR